MSVGPSSEPFPNKAPAAMAAATRTTAAAAIGPFLRVVEVAWVAGVVFGSGTLRVSGKMPVGICQFCSTSRTVASASPSAGAITPSDRADAISSGVGLPSGSLDSAASTRGVSRAGRSGMSGSCWTTRNMSAAGAPSPNGDWPVAA